MLYFKYNKGEEKMREKNIEEIKEMPRNDGWEPIPTIGENEGWLGGIEEW